MKNCQVEELEKVLDAPLHVLYLKQLTLLREKALKTFRSTVAAAPDGGNEYEAMIQVNTSIFLTSTLKFDICLM